MRGQSAVYDDCLSGDIPGVVRGEKGNGGCHIFRFTQIRRGTLSQKDVADIFIQIIQGGGSQYQSGRYGVATDILFAQLGGDIFSQVDDTCFAGSV